MNNQDNLSDALAQNGAFDAKRADQVRTAALASFDARLRKVDRWLMAYLCVLTWLFVLTLFYFVQATATKALLFYGLLMLIFFEGTVLMKLWYWMMNTKIGILKALKEMQLDQAAGRIETSTGGSESPLSPLKGISRTERRIWWIVMAVGGGVIGAFFSTQTSHRVSANLAHEGVITLAADGSGAARTMMTLTNKGLIAVRHLNFYAPEGNEVRFLDSAGNELPTASSKQQGGDHVRYDVNLRHWIWMGQRGDYTRVAKGKDWATQTDGLWTYTNDYMYGYDETDFTQTVVLPPGAEVTSAVPWPANVYTLGDRTAVRFEGVRGRNERFKFSVQYRLPAGG